MANIKENTVSVNGRLKEHYTLKLTMKQEDSIDCRDSLVIRLKLTHDKDKGSRIELIKKEGVAKLYINNLLVLKQNVDIDTKVNDEIPLLNYKEDLLVTDPLLLNVKAVLEVDDDSEFIVTTEVEDSFILKAKQEQKLFIDLDYRESTTLIFCTVETTLEPDFLEYKTNFKDWTRLPDKTQNFSIVKNRTRYLGTGKRKA